MGAAAGPRRAAAQTVPVDSVSTGGASEHPLPGRVNGSWKPTRAPGREGETRLETVLSIAAAPDPRLKSTGTTLRPAPENSVTRTGKRALELLSADSVPLRKFFSVCDVFFDAKKWTVDLDGLPVSLAALFGQADQSLRDAKLIGARGGSSHGVLVCLARGKETEVWHLSSSRALQKIEAACSPRARVIHSGSDTLFFTAQNGLTLDLFARDETRWSWQFGPSAELEYGRFPSGQTGLEIVVREPLPYRRPDGTDGQLSAIQFSLRFHSDQINARARGEENGVAVGFGDLALPMFSPSHGERVSIEFDPRDHPTPSTHAPASAPPIRREAANLAADMDSIREGYGPLIDFDGRPLSDRAQRMLDAHEGGGKERLLEVAGALYRPQERLPAHDPMLATALGYEASTPSKGGTMYLERVSGLDGYKEHEKAMWAIMWQRPGESSPVQYKRIAASDHEAFAQLTRARALVSAE